MTPTLVELMLCFILFVTERLLDVDATSGFLITDLWWPSLSSILLSGSIEQSETSLAFFICLFEVSAKLILAIGYKNAISKVSLSPLISLVKTAENLPAKLKWIA